MLLYHSRNTLYITPYTVVCWWHGSTTILFIWFMPMFFLFSIQPCTKFHYVFQQKLPQYVIHQNWRMTNQQFEHTGVCRPSWQICVCCFNSEPFCQKSFSKSLKHKVSHLSDIVSEIPFLLSVTDFPSKTTPFPYDSSDFTQDSGSVKVPYIHQTLWTGKKAITLLESIKLVDLSPVQDVASAACVFTEPPASCTGALRSTP